jgi:chromosome partitioning protein
VQEHLNEKLEIGGVLLTMFDARLNLSRQVVSDAREHFGDRVFDTIVPRNIRLAEAPSFGKPIVLYDITSVGAQAYMAVARELLARDAALAAQTDSAAGHTDDRPADDSAGAPAAAPAAASADAPNADEPDVGATGAPDAP